MNEHVSSEKPPKSKGKARFIFILKIVISLGMLAALFFFVDWTKLKDAMQVIRWPMLFAGLGILFICMWLMTYKWWLLLGKVNINKVFACCMASRFFALLPTGQLASEVSKVAMLGRSGSGVVVNSFTVVLDKLTGIICILIMALVGIASADSKFTLVIYVVVVAVMLVVLCGIIFIILKVKNGDRFLQRISFLNKNALGKIIYKFFAKTVIPCCGCLTSWCQLGLHMLSGVAFQIVSMLVYSVIGSMMGIRISLLDWFWVFSVMSMAVFIPISIGGIGLREGALTVLLSSIGVEPALATTLGLIATGLHLINSLIGGLFYLPFLRTKREASAAEAAATHAENPGGQ